MTEIYKNPDLCFDNPEEVLNEWNEKKIFILNSKILEHLFTETFKKLIGDEEVSRDDDNYTSATGDMKERLMKVFLDLLNVEERELNYFYSDKYYKVPARSFFRNNYDNFRIKYDKIPTEMQGL